MTHWREYLKPDEAKRIEELDEIRRESAGEFRKIAERARKRMERAPNTPPGGSYEEGK